MSLKKERLKLYKDKIEKILKKAAVKANEEFKAFQADKAIDTDLILTTLELAEEFKNEQKAGDKRFREVEQLQREKHYNDELAKSKKKLEAEAEILRETRLAEEGWKVKVEQFKKEVSEFHQLANELLTKQNENWWKNYEEE